MRRLWILVSKNGNVGKITSTSGERYAICFFDLEKAASTCGSFAERGSWHPVEFQIAEQKPEETDAETS